VVGTDDGRELAVETAGDPQGRPVFLMHGTPGSRIGPRPRTTALYRLGVRLITYDRPGYGRSGRLPGRRVADAARDVEAIADHLGIKRFAVVGRSGGGPHALACAYALPERVTRCASLVSLAPFGAEGLDWFDGMVQSNVDAYRKASAHGPSELVPADLVAHAPIGGDLGPDDLLRKLDSEWRMSDRQVVKDAGIRRQLLASYSEAVRQSEGPPFGWVDDVLALSDPGGWGFHPKDIDDRRVGVLLYHGEHDIYSPASHTRWLAERIRHAELRIDPGVSHFDNLIRLPEILAWAAGGAD